MEPSRHPLDESGAPADPVTLFARWMDDVVAAGLPEPTAMVLATVSPACRPGPYGAAEGLRGGGFRFLYQSQFS